jgi:hypothetical protein
MKPEVLKLCGPPLPGGGGTGPRLGGGVVCMRDIFILNKMGETHLGRRFALLKYFITYFWYWLQTISSTFCRRVLFMA